MWLFPWVNLFEKDLDLCENRLNCSGDASTACFGLHSRKNVIAIKIGKDSAAFSTFLIVFLDVFNNLEISFLDMPSDKYLKISLYFSSYCFKIKNSFPVKYFVDTMLIYTLILQEKECILYDWSI